jgi:ketosteroid isomerase-like protein
MELIGKYQIVRVLGEGGMGRVYEAFDPVIGRRVAIKTIAMQIVSDSEARARFFIEAQAVGRLSHPNIVTLHDTGDQDGRPYLVMEFLEGQDLGRVIRAGQQSLDVKLRLIMEVCAGLAYAHGQDVIHRDIKPANIFVTTESRVKLLDFGLARGAISELTQTGRVLGTPNYMAPEQIRGEPIDHRVDIFSTGVVLYELLTGRRAFEGDTVAATIYKVLETSPAPLQDFDAQLPPGLSDVVDRALAKSRTERYQTIAEMFQDLAEIRRGIGAADSVVFSPVTSPLTVPTPRPATPARLTVQPRTPATPRSAAGGQTPPPVTPASGGDAVPPRRFDWRLTGIVAALVLAVVAVVMVVRGAGRRPTAEPSNPAPVPVAAVPPPPAEAKPDAAPPATGAAPAGASAEQSAAIDRASSPTPATSTAPRGEISSPRGRSRPSPAVTDAREAEPPPAATRPDVPEQPPRKGFGYGAADRPDGRPQSRPPAPTATRAPAPAPPPSPPPAVQEPGPSASATRTTTAPAPTTPAAAPPAAPVPVPARSAPAGATAPPPTETESATAAIRNVLARYQAAMQARDIGALKTIWPGLSEREESALRNEFAYARSIQVGLDNVAVQVTGGTATATCRRDYTVTTNEGRTLETTTRMIVTLEHRAGSWAIVAIRHELTR